MPRKKSTTPQKPLLMRSPDGRGKAKAQEPTMANLKQEEEEEEEEETAIFSSPPPSSSSSPNAVASPSCLSLLNYSCTKPSPEKLPELHEQWRESQRATAAQISRQLKLKWALDSLVDSHLQKLRAHLTSPSAAAGPSHLPRALLPPWDPPLLTAAASWLGCTWRPSAVLSLVGRTVSGPLAPRTHRIIEEAIRRFRIEEAVLEEEMVEYQTMSVLSLRGPGTQKERRRRVWEEVRKVEGVVERAGRLRYRAVETVVRGAALEEAQAAEFIVALAGVEEVARRAAARWRARAGAVAVEVQAFD